MARGKNLSWQLTPNPPIFAPTARPTVQSPLPTPERWKNRKNKLPSSEKHNDTDGREENKREPQLVLRTTGHKEKTTTDQNGGQGRTNEDCWRGEYQSKTFVNSSASFTLLGRLEQGRHCLKKLCVLTCYNHSLRFRSKVTDRSHQA